MLNGYVPQAVGIAQDIVDMHNTIIYLRREVERLEKYEKLYTELLDQSIKHDGKMMNNLLGVLLTPGVTTAIAEHARKDQSPSSA